ncbi:MAG: hypothetical protein AAF937_02545 [Planctomycetota bacterium]
MGKVGGFVVALIIAGVVLGMRFSDKGDASGEYREQVSALLATLPDYAEAEAYYEGLCDQHHEECFDNHYRIGSRRSGPSFDSDAYIHELLKRMAADARANGHTVQAEHLAFLEKDVVTVPADG